MLRMVSRADTGTLDPLPSRTSLERRAVPFRETIVRVAATGEFGLVRWSGRRERGVDFLCVQFRPLDTTGAETGGFARPAAFDGASDTVRVLVTTGDGTVTMEEAPSAEPVAAYLRAQAAAWAGAHYPEYDATAPWEPEARRAGDLADTRDRDALAEVAPDDLVAELRAAQARTAALEGRLPVLCDERNLLRERIVRLTAACVVLGGLAAVLAAPLLG